MASMSWWRRRSEIREAGSYTETQLLDQYTRAIAGNVRNGALGGLQCAAGALARAFAAAEVDGSANGLLDPTTLYSMGFDLIRDGQTIWLLDGGTGRLRLSRASTGSDVYQGAAARESWTYRLTLPGPSITTTVRASADQVIHIIHNSDPTCPWRGRSGLSVAQSSGSLAATLVRGLTSEGEIPVTRIIPQPQGESKTTADSLRHAISTGLRLALPETAARGRRRWPIFSSAYGLETVPTWAGLHGGRRPATPLWRYKKPLVSVVCLLRWCLVRQRPGQRGAKHSVSLWRSRCNRLDGFLRLRFRG